jgi:hypothetical protein
VNERPTRVETGHGRPAVQERGEARHERGERVIREWNVNDAVDRHLERVLERKAESLRVDTLRINAAPLGEGDGARDVVEVNMGPQDRFVELGEAAVAGVDQLVCRYRLVVLAEDGRDKGEQMPALVRPAPRRRGRLRLPGRP